MKEDLGKLVSAIIVTHNRAELLPRAIESVVNQTYKNLEILIVDDGSRDNTEEVVHFYQKKDPRIRYLKFEESRGACAARNHGISEATGEFVAGLDDDDEWMPRRVEVLLRNYQDKFAFVCSRDRIINKKEQINKKRPSQISYNDMLYRMVASNQILTKRERVLKVGGYDTNLISSQDFDLYMRLMKEYGKAKVVKNYLQNIYRNHLNIRISNSKTKNKGSLEIYRKYKCHMSTRQKIVRIVALQKRKNKKVKLLHLLVCIGRLNSIHNIKYYLKKTLLKNTLINS